LPHLTRRLAQVDIRRNIEWFSSSRHLLFAGDGASLIYCPQAARKVDHFAVARPVEIIFVSCEGSLAGRCMRPADGVGTFRSWSIAERTAMQIMTSVYPFLDAAALQMHIVAPLAAGPRPLPIVPRNPSLWQPMACPACGHQLRVPADAIGRVGRCRACACEFLIPAEERAF
jgi:hypothetical protein